jgi:hypothetical protein
MNLTKSLLKLIGCCSLIALLSGCASVICGPKQAVAIDSKPHGAEVLVYDSHCDVVFQQTTPCTAKLPRRTPDYDAANYVILIKKEGYAPVQIPLTGQVNRAYFANVLTAGIGFAVDPITGGMWTLSPDAVDSSAVTENAVTEKPGFLVSLKQEETVAPDVAQQDQPLAK